MFKNDLKIAVRNLLKHKIFSFINIAGLAIGMACCILILLFVRDELSYDRFHEHADRIYRILLETPTPVAPVTANTPMVLAPKLQESFPEIREIARLEKYSTKVTVKHKEKQFTETRFFLAEPSVFDIFSFRLIHGDPQTALLEPNTVILTESTARRYFGDESPLQQQIEVAGKGLFTITGVVADIAKQSHLHFDFLASLVTIKLNRDRPWDHWGYTYLLLPENSTPLSLEEKLNTLADDYEYLGWGIHNMKFRLQPLTDIHLRSQHHSEIEANSDIRSKTAQLHPPQKARFR